MRSGNDGSARFKIGERLSELRKKNDWTLEDVSKMTGVGISTLSKLEKQQTNLSFDTWLKLSEGLGLSFQEFVNPQGAGRVMRGCRAVTRANGGVRFSTKHYDYSIHSSELLATKMIPLVMTIKARSADEIETFSSHPGEEFILCLDGTVELLTEFYAPLRLEKGDSAYIDSETKHAFISVGAGEASILSVVSGGKAAVDQVRDLIAGITERAGPS